VNSGHTSDMNKSLIIITSMFLLGTMGNKTSLIMLKRTIKAVLNLIDPLTGDRHEEQSLSASKLKSSNFLRQPQVAIQDEEYLSIRSWLRKNKSDKTLPYNKAKTIVIYRLTSVKTMTSNQLRRAITRRRWSS
jgi:predicted transcriptional regulator